MGENTRLGNFFSRISSHMCSRGLSSSAYAEKEKQAVNLRHHQHLGHLRRCVIHDHDDEVLVVDGADLGQEGSHPSGVHGRGNHPVQFSFQRTDDPVNILEFTFVAVVYRGTFRGGNGGRLLVEGGLKTRPGGPAHPQGGGGVFERGPEQSRQE